MTIAVQNLLVLEAKGRRHIINVTILGLTPSRNDRFFNGFNEFIDVWGHPYNIRLVSEMGTNFGRIDRRVQISLVGHDK
jgi:hypothetical protein